MKNLEELKYEIFFDNEKYITKDVFENINLFNPDDNPEKKLDYLINFLTKFFGTLDGKGLKIFFEDFMDMKKTGLEEEDYNKMINKISNNLITI